ncbi:MAG: hypothetical protein KGZ82_03425 [Bacteroidales bacterium]|nr:hypothetical protein [Bacteroidales bacterium]
MKKFFLYATVVTLALFSACKKSDSPSLNPPAITPPASQVVKVGTSADISFDYTADAGFKSATVSATNGTASIKTDGVAGATSGKVVVLFTAGTQTGAGSVELTITDDKANTTTSTAVISVELEQTTFYINSNISENTTWMAGKTYVLQSRIAVLNGVTLTIEPGVVVKGEAGTGANATALLIARGAKLMAEGTAEAPIIFTSVADEIAPGEITSPNLDPNFNGLWGGLLILGKAPISAAAESVQIEGIPPSDQNGLYGGTVSDDNSGVIRYVSIRHGGANIGEGNEINGLTLGGVGSGTVINNIEIVANQDDGVEFFGGTVNVSNAIVWNAGDDGFDTDQAWGGTLDNFAVLCGPNTDHSLEIDGPEGAYNAGNIVKNGTIKGNPASQLGDFRDGARGSFENIYFFNFADPANGRGDLSLSGTETNDNFQNGILTFNNLQVSLPAGVTDMTLVFHGGTDVHATNVAPGANTVGVNASVFGWTWASQAGELTGF